MSERKISLITMSQGNVKALKRTMESFKYVVDEFIYGDVLIFPEDRTIIHSYKKEFNLKTFELPFNYIFQMGFSSILNYLAANAKNNMVLYMNTSEVIDEDYGINQIINQNEDCNCFYFSHRIEKHRWFRCFDRREVLWRGRIHEESSDLRGKMQPYHKPIFMMADTEKDMDDLWKASVFNLIKNLTYFEQYRKIVEYTKLVEGTNEGWIKWAKEQTPTMEERLLDFGVFYESFKSGDYKNFMTALKDYDVGDFDFNSSDLINFQGARKDIL